MDITLLLDVALCVVGNLYKYSAWPQLKKGAVTCRSCWFLQMMDAQSSKERWEISGGQNLYALGGEQRWGFCLAELFPTQRTLVLHFWCLLHDTSWEENGTSLQGWCCSRTCALLMLVSIFSSHFSKAGRWPLYFTYCLTRRQWIPCKSCLQCPSALQAWQPFPQAHNLPSHTFVICHSETPAMRSSSSHHQYLLFRNSQQRINILQHFSLLSFLMEQAQKTQVISHVRNRTGCVLIPHSYDCHCGLQVNTLLLVVCVGSHSPKISCLHQFSCSEGGAHVLPAVYLSGYWIIRKSKMLSDGQRWFIRSYPIWDSALLVPPTSSYRTHRF